MKKYFFLFIFLLLCNSLFAMSTGDKIVYPSFGIGFSGGNFKAINGQDLGLLISGDSTMYKNPSPELSFAYNLGFGFDYFMTDKVALSAGIYYENRPCLVVYEKNTAANDFEVEFDFSFLTIPIGLRYYFEMLFLGGGLYYGKLLSDDATVKADYTVDVQLEDTHDDIGFFLDFGFSHQLSETGSIIIFARYKRGLTYVYDAEDIVTDLKIIDLTINFGYGIRI